MIRSGAAVVLVLGLVTLAAAADAAPAILSSDPKGPRPPAGSTPTVTPSETPVPQTPATPPVSAPPAAERPLPAPPE